MLTQLYIRNYILIDELHLSFSDGFTVITGETGAGKSVVIGALAQLLGDRFDQKMFFDAQQKCVIEGTFQLNAPELPAIFEKNDLDFLPQTIIRREMAVGGRSRIFVNDTPVSANCLKEIGRFLVDIHSQHETLALQNNLFQLNVVDRFGKLETNAARLETHFYAIRQLKDSLSEKKSTLQQLLREQEYRHFVVNELEQCRIKPHETQNLEQSLQLLSQSDSLLQWSEKIHFQLLSDESPIVGNLEQLVSESKKFHVDDERIISLGTRLNQCAIELKDIALEAENLSSTLESDPEQLEKSIQRLDVLNNLIFKYHVSSSDDLLTLLQQYQETCYNSETLALEVQQLEHQIADEEVKWNTEAKNLSEQRSALFPVMAQQMTQLLQSLGMPEAQLIIKAQPIAPCEHGIDQISFLFSANRGISPNEIKKVASGGEMSRIMLSIKYLISESLPLSTFIFDEIDTGISGSVATKVSAMLQKIAEKKQIITITHLPSIAACGKNHLYIYKTTNTTKTSISARYLNNQERITEIAQMIGGDKTEKSTIETAKHLLQEQ
ncbi:MAG: DNA repair protein RecN [Bacteroidales bacterium]|nr:DNA repair protein RecN [Bacteroidales bacterium]